MSAASKAPTMTSSKAAAELFISTFKVGTTIGGGALYVGWFLLILSSKGLTFEVEGNSATIYKAGKAVAIAGWSKAQVLNSLTDMAGNPIVDKGPLMVERILAWAQQGKVVANVKGIVLGKAPRVAIAAGKLPA